MDKHVQICLIVCVRCEKNTLESSQYNEFSNAMPYFRTMLTYPILKSFDKGIVLCVLLLQKLKVELFAVQEILFSLLELS